MSRNTLQRVSLVILCLFTVSGLAACQSEDQVITIGVISAAPVMDFVFQGFKEGMEEDGYIEGENIVYNYDGAPESLDQLREIADGLVAAEVDLILALSTPAAVAAKEATAETPIPVVFVPVTDPISAGLVASLNEPGGNMTGVTNGGSEPRRLELLVEITEAQRIYVPYNETELSALSALQTAEAAALELGVELVARPAPDSEQMRIAASNIPEGVDALFMLPDAQAVAYTQEFVDLTIQNRLPFSSPTVDQVRAGALLSFGIDFFLAGKQAARLADQILSGDNPAELPVETAEFFLYINLKTAEAIGLEIEEAFLSQAIIIRE
jgi:putative ABC transport system substrate-binding protein